jgi:sulfate adenylyltransferase subunit 2
MLRCNTRLSADWNRLTQAPWGVRADMSSNSYVAGESAVVTRAEVSCSDKSPAHLRVLEAESIQILREVAGQAANPVVLYSIGKDSSVLLHLVRKAFYPAKPPFPLLHIDTTWKFRAMIEFRDTIVARHGFELRRFTNPEGLRQNINPFDHGSGTYTQVMKTDALKQALTEGKYDFAIGGARRDEERSRAKERIFSIRAPGHIWDPKRQRPELWNIYNGLLAPGETMRVFPLSNWTELDVWTYIRAEAIDVVPLYFAARRPTVIRDGVVIMVDDERMRFEPGETPVERLIRFRSLGCYPLSAAVESSAATLDEIVDEMLTTRVSERAGRLIDKDQDSSMENKKREGYF